jgi:uncharacterized membrane protein
METIIKVLSFLRTFIVLPLTITIFVFVFLVSFVERLRTSKNFVECLVSNALFIDEIATEHTNKNQGSYFWYYTLGIIMWFSIYQTFMK